MNVRTRITMDPEVQRRAHAKAAELGISFAEYVRRLVARPGRNRAEAEAQGRHFRHFRPRDRRRAD